MNKKIIISFLTAGVLLLSACSKNTDIFVPDAGQLNGPDTTWQVTVTSTMPVSSLKTSLLIEPYLDSIEVNANTATLNTPLGVQVIFPPNSCVTAAGAPISGKIQVELLALKKKGDMVRMSKPTTTYDSLLVTAGEIFVRLKKDGLPVQLAPNARIYIKYADLPINTGMKLFFGDESNPQQFNWLPNQDLVNNVIGMGTQGYEISTNHLRWINIAYGFNTASTPTVQVVADLAPYFTNANTVAFTVLKDFRSLAGMHGDLSTKKFISPRLPVGKAITVVVISKQANDYYLGYESAVTLTPTNGTVNQVVSVRPVKKSLPEIIAYLSTL
ncbi:MAG: hypothetical protein IPP96_16385 [Chitinophagaceae bacterium]|nr:hypothetical protein [Chitinophagaceae bacterium]